MTSFEAFDRNACIQMKASILSCEVGGSQNALNLKSTGEAFKKYTGAWAPAHRGPSHGLE